MDVLNPELLWIDGICYRLPVISSENLKGNQSGARLNEWPDYGKRRINFQLYAVLSLLACFTETIMSPFFLENTICESGNYPDDEYDDNDASEVESQIQLIAENRYELHLPVAQTFWPQIIGSKGVTKKRIENDTGTKISIPRQMEHGDIQIRGSSKKSILLAKKCIDAIVSSARQKLTFTHFISLPINNETIKKNFIAFKEDVIKYFGENRGVEESIFQNPEKLHLTLGTLVLTDQRERKIAEEKLKEVYEQAIRPLLDNRKVKIEIKGIEYMNDDPAEVDVLYGKVFSLPDKNLLQNIADCILDYFILHKLIRASERHNVKLHVTLMNTLFREQELEEINIETVGLNKNKKSRKPRNTFNAVNILEKFQEYYFGQEELKRIELSVRFSTAKNGYYKSSSIIQL